MALTPEAVAALSNLGLVKRALKEIEQGKGPRLVEEPDGTVVGVFEDGVTTRLVPQKTLKDNPCSCPAVGVCRHRVAVALAYRGWQSSLARAPISVSDAASDTGAAPVPASGSASVSVSGSVSVSVSVAVAVSAPAPDLTWTPGALADDALRTLLGKRAFEDASTTRRRGLVVEIVRATVEQPVPTAKLPSCTVRFLVPHELAYARCDCQVGQGCTHVALSVWAFREADARDRARHTMAVELREAKERRGPAEDLAPMLALVRELAETGVVHAREALAQRFVLAGEKLAKAGYTWPATGLEDLASMLERYRARSARYHAADALALVTELAARARAASREPSALHPELPVRYVLGQGEAMETKLDHLRLVSLGARIDSDGRERSAEILLADPDTATVMVLARTWSFAEGEAMPEGPELGRRRVAGASTLAQLASGQVVTRVARRRASRALVIGQSAVGSTSVTPQTGDFSSLPKPLRVESLRELAQSLAAQPPRMLRPRVLAESVHAVRVSRIGRCGFDPGAQRLAAEAFDPEGVAFLISSPFRGAAPHALDVLGQALSGGMGEVRWIAGGLAHDGHLFTLDPTLVVADRVVAPDVEERGGSGALATVRQAAASPGRVAQRLEAAHGILEEAFHLGLTATPSSYDARLERVTRDLEEVGARGLADRLTAYAVMRARRRAGEDVPVAPSFFDAAIRVELAREASRSHALAAMAGVPGEMDPAQPVS